MLQMNRENPSPTLREIILMERAEGREEGREEGIAEGKEVGRAEGREEGRLEGRAEGRAEGEKEVQQEIAQKMLLKGMSTKEVSDLTGLAIEETREIKKKLEEDSK